MLVENTLYKENEMNNISNDEYNNILQDSGDITMSEAAKDKLILYYENLVASQNDSIKLLKEMLKIKDEQL